MPKPNVRKSRKSVKSQALNKSRSSTRKNKKLIDLKGKNNNKQRGGTLRTQGEIVNNPLYNLKLNENTSANENEKLVTELVNCSDYSKDETSCLEEKEGLCNYNQTSGQCMQTDCLTKYGDDKQNCLKDKKCEIDEYKKDNSGNIISGTGLCKNKKINTESIYFAGNKKNNTNSLATNFMY